MDERDRTAEEVARLRRTVVGIVVGAVVLALMVLAYNDAVTRNCIGKGGHKVTGSIIKQCEEDFSVDPGVFP